MPHNARYSGPERRDLSPQGRGRRAQFAVSVKLLADLGLSPDAIEYYRRLARKKKTLPHDLVRALAEEEARWETTVAKIKFDAGRPA